MKLEELVIRDARPSDLPSLVAMYAADTLGGHSDTTDGAADADYLNAFNAIHASPNDTLYVAEIDGKVVGTFQATLITVMTGRGATNMKIEAVQTREDMRGSGIGSAMIRFAIEQARAAGAASVQLSSNAARHNAHRFYERLGFEKSHVAFKMKLK
ncbi:GNAT family N-acetyltransferase [Chelativorans sp. YIM 93263]|uniref:GNAT family N-acetyltransferase n=1 Tax=Chelativorans sp. YIM 93263 TaxID=2906648 RepID=UPI00237A03D1|nr:GNAT family N-acetyltransferase [Chelativorans sp. YIM 93263]